jgi:DNA-binding MltR family transcriptional regulator
MAKNTPRVPTPQAILDKLPEMFRALSHESDAICAIVGTSHLEHALRSFLRANLVNGNTSQELLDPVKGALGQLSTATSAAYCMGLISKECKSNIDTIGLIRNRFAHSVDDVKFSDSEVATLCEKLRWSWKGDSETDPSLITSDRAKFTMVLSDTSTQLLGAAFRGSGHREQSKDYVGRW